MLEWIVLFFVGGFGYGQIELLYRGSTHWTMLVAGGSCLMLLRLIDQLCYGKLPYLIRCGIGAGCITAIEFIFGVICNKLLHWHVWDYSHEWGNLWGQICPRYTLYWFGICLPVFAVFALLRQIPFFQKLTQPN